MDERKKHPEPERKNRRKFKRVIINGRPRERQTSFRSISKYDNIEKPSGVVAPPP